MKEVKQRVEIEKQAWEENYMKKQLYYLVKGKIIPFTCALFYLKRKLYWHKKKEN